MHGAHVNVERPKFLDNNAGDTFDVANLSYVDKVIIPRLNGINKLGNIHSVLAMLIQKHIHVEGFIMRVDVAVCYTSVRVAFENL